MKKDYYRILGVSRNASQEEIKKAYRRLAHQYHPDRPTGDEVKFKEINEAYQVLSDEKKRRQYDQFGQTFDGFSFDNEPFAWGNFDFSGLDDINDIFESFFEGLGLRKRKTYRRGSDIELILPLTLEEVYFGVEKEASFNALGVCENCSGLGHFPKDGFSHCAACNGQGEIKETRSTFFGSFAQIKTCVKCSGLGKIPNKICSRCQGAGRISQKKTVRVFIAPGVQDGQIIKITNAGEAGERGAGAGDLYVRVKIKPHKLFTVRGSDLIMEKKVDALDLLLDNKVKIQTLSGKEIELKIPEGAVLNKEFCVKKEGMPYFNSKKFGDLYIRLNVKMPKKSIIQKLKKALGK